MGRKSNHFRHSFNAHKDPKIMELIDREGIKGLGFYYVLLEIYGAAYIDDDAADLTQTLHVRTLASASALRADSVKKLLIVCSELGLVSRLQHETHSAYFQLSIDNFLKYFGKYSKTEPIKNPNKRKENKRKEKEIKNTKKAPPVNLSDTTKIIEFWNSQKIIVHTVNDKLLADVQKLFERKKISVCEIIKAIQNYKFILTDETYLWSHKWGLKEFLGREKAEKFYPGEFDTGRFPAAKVSNAQEKANKMLNMENPYA